MYKAAVTPGLDGVQANDVTFFDSPGFRVVGYGTAHTRFRNVAFGPYGEISVGPELLQSDGFFSVHSRC